MKEIVSNFLMVANGIFQVDLCFDQLVFKLSEHIFAYYKSVAARYNIDWLLGDVTETLISETLISVT